MRVAKALFGLALGWAANNALAQTAPSPADVGVSKGSPDVFKLLDSTKTWTPFGSVNPGTHIFSPATNGSIPTGNCVKWGPGIQDAGVSCGTGTGVPAFGETDILATDPAVGMVANTGQDNSPFVAALMTKAAPPLDSGSGGYDVTFPSIPGQPYTVYYFSQPLVISRPGNFRCSGIAPSPSTFLLFAAGVDGVVQNPGTFNSDGGWGTGTIGNCFIASLGYGSAKVNTATPKVLTNVGFYYPSGLGGSPASAWHVGDSLIVASAYNLYMPSSAQIPIAPGTTITAIDGTTGDLTLSGSGVNNSLGGSYYTHATVTFTETGSNNFAVGDTVHVGANTYTFASAVSHISGGFSPYSVLVGANFDASAANLVSAISATAGAYATYQPSSVGEGAFERDPWVTASYASPVISFASRFSGLNTNSFPAVYTHAGTAAGVFSAATFSGAVTNVEDLKFYQFPATQAFKVQTTSGGNAVTVVSGPRIIREGDAIWTDAFPFGAVVSNATGTVGAQTLTITVSSDSGVALNATLTHAPGAEANLWVVPAGIKRRVGATAENNHMNNWPIGQAMLCNFTNCDLSRDTNNFHQLNLIGRWVGGSNTATASSINEQFGANFLMDVFEGGELGEIYFNLNSESTEDGTSRYSIVKNCANQNYSMVFGAYIAYGGNGCSGDGMLYPPTYGGVSTIGALSGGGNNGSVVAYNDSHVNGLTITGGPDGAQCVNILGGAGSWYALAFSSYNCEATNTVGLGWDTDNKSWAWAYQYPNSGEMRFVETAWGSVGYMGPGSGGVDFPSGILLGDAVSSGGFAGNRFLGMSPIYPPVPSVYSQGDVVFNTSATAGGAALWEKVGSQFLPAAPVANDINGTSWTLGNTMKLTPVAIASLPTCNAGAAGSFAVVNNAAAPTYGGAVSATGAVTSPVFCTGSGWTYH